MNIRISTVSGFCMGVKKAIDNVLEAVHAGKGRIFVDGPIIHNPQVISLLEEKGVRILDESITLNPEDTVIIRAHGVPPEREQTFKDKGCRVINSTCPLVSRIQDIIRKEKSAGKTIVIIGEKGHPEVTGLQGYAGGSAEIIESMDKIADLPQNTPLAVVAQSTQDLGKFTEIENRLRETFPEAVIYNTICRATKDRQEAVEQLALHNDAVIVVGGKNSGNTKRLVQISSRLKPTFHIETEEELSSEEIADYKNIGIAGGASTPNWMIIRTKEKISRISEQQENIAVRFLNKTIRFTVNSNILTAVSAFFLATAWYHTTDIPNRKTYIFLAILYIFAMHTLNRFLKFESYTYTSPAKALFLGKGRMFFFSAGIISLLTAFIISALINIEHLLIFIACSIPGVLYPLRIIPPFILKKKGWNSLKDIPGSKDIFVGAGWAFIIVLFPVLGNTDYFSIITIPAFIFIFLLTVTRSVLLDIMDIPGDRISGNDTLPIIIGEQQTRYLLGAVLTILTLMLAAGTVFSLIGLQSLIFLLPIAYFAITTILYSEKTTYYPVAYETVIELNFILTGILALSIG